MTHIHLDHVSGFPDIPNDVPIPTGAHEAEATLFLNLIAQGTNNHLLDGRSCQVPVPGRQMSSGS
jgi:N-acyl homoserine lactone hydrolase